MPARKSTSPYLSPRNETIGAAIQRLRKLRGMTQAELAAAMKDRGAEWNTSTLWALESGGQSLRAAEVFDLAEVLGVGLSEILSPDTRAADVVQVVLAASREVVEAEHRLRSAVSDHHHARLDHSVKVEAARERFPTQWAELPEQLPAMALEALADDTATIVADQLALIAATAEEESKK